jgi:hypothetical protein
MYTARIQETSVAAEPLLSQAQISQLVPELKHTWTWDG